MPPDEARGSHDLGRPDLREGSRMKVSERRLGGLVAVTIGKQPHSIPYRRAPFGRGFSRSHTMFLRRQQRSLAGDPGMQTTLCIPRLSQRLTQRCLAEDDSDKAAITATFGSQGKSRTIRVEIEGSSGGHRLATVKAVKSGKLLADPDAAVPLRVEHGVMFPDVFVFPLPPLGRQGAQVRHHSKSQCEIEAVTGDDLGGAKGNSSSSLPGLSRQLQVGRSMRWSCGRGNVDDDDDTMVLMSMLE
ncbi:hypothetical protein NM208_g13848 [Fusarium decemcellulare]|uniref:Uncharacterized protein n=1 Tax=Fusarium decemcellulare TaxID=57161 RepID=A0ACC1RJH7_9HYPO|nr:hypothetical protein NM208_g13848 [Fusarium decemcellulare]